jgi:hypothetical protein
VIEFLKSVVALRICQAGKKASKKLSYSVAHARAGVAKRFLLEFMLALKRTVLFMVVLITVDARSDHHQLQCTLVDELATA